MTRSLNALMFVALAAAGGSLGAQARPQPQEGKDGTAQVPRTHLPPPGMCRIWLDKVPPAQQPAPTDCANAVRNQPRNGRVIFSDSPRNPTLPIVKSLKPPATGRGDPATPQESPPPAPAKPVRPDAKQIIKPVRPDSES